MRKATRFIIILLISIAVLAISKPDDKNFEKWVNKKYSKIINTNKSDNVLSNLAEKGISKATAFQLINSHQYTNYFVVSEVVAWANLEKRKYIGILGFWIPIHTSQK